MWFTRCAEPGCTGPAEVVDRPVLESTDGPIEHVHVRCVHRHWFLMPVASLPPMYPVPVDFDVAAGHEVADERP